MRKFVLFSFLCFASLFSREFKIYDTFLFFNEMELLRIRLEELYDEVDYFVLVESNLSFRGLPKPLHFQENKHLFANYLPKLIHVVVADDISVDRDNAWAREDFQRNAILRGLSGANGEDLVIVSDVDEIPKRGAISLFVKGIKEEGREIVRSEGLFYRFFLNRQEHFNWAGPVIGSYASLRRITPAGFRSIREHQQHLAIPSSHWHFTSMGGYESYYTKINSFSHWNEYKTRPLTPEELYESVQHSLIKAAVDNTFPHYVQEHLDYFIQIAFIDNGNGLPEPFSPFVFHSLEAVLKPDVSRF